MIYVKLTAGKVIYPFAIEQEELTLFEQADILSHCPSIDLRNVSEKAEILEFLQSLIAFYLQVPRDVCTLDKPLLQIEKHAWAKELEVKLETVTHGRLFCAGNKNVQPQGGISDEGMFLAALFMFDIADVTGLHMVEEQDDYTFSAQEDAFKSYYECNTIAELADLFFDVSNYANSAN